MNLTSPPPSKGAAQLVITPNKLIELQKYQPKKATATAQVADFF
jgi:hypothetical protein